MQFCFCIYIKFTSSVYPQAPRRRQQLLAFPAPRPLADFYLLACHAASGCLLWRKLVRLHHLLMVELAKVLARSARRTLRTVPLFLWRRGTLNDRGGAAAVRPIFRSEFVRSGESLLRGGRTSRATAGACETGSILSLALIICILLRSSFSEREAASG